MQERLRKKDYLERLAPLQLALADVERWVAATGQRLLLLVEGRDAAGKGGVVRALAETLNPRHCRVVALDKPSDRERGQWYFQRYVAQLPARGEIVLMDRSWYNRAGVEKVMGYCSESEYRHFLAQAPVFESLLVDDGILLAKYWLGVDQAQQEQRFAERAIDPLKRWKLSPVDLKAREHYAEYGKAREAMLAVTHTAQAPWTIVDFNDQRRGRLSLIRHWLEQLPCQVTPEKRLRLPPLGHRPLPERWGVLAPIADSSERTDRPSFTRAKRK
ncbi:polyphosphate kinase 2 [Silanimonas sp.]|uniref:polyphosphate kinase 2 n=1 Tax=Silanimonas sp. TaxID=1929290 RepID=UPI001BBDEAA4|nr:polyphosphate kinase 2 [Silanimonas sp.]MBS3895171.1 polyphosphate kinase 2 [Silanimonas sp.]MBS3924942.1 polyphosphate kinase 2 [Xanthomonadaceae bacterium]